MTNFVELAQRVGTLLEEKNAHYGSAFSSCGDFLRLLYPQGIKPEQFTDMLLLVRIYDKMCRIASSNRDTDGENPFKDIAGYGILGMTLVETQYREDSWGTTDSARSANVNTPKVG